MKSTEASSFLPLTHTTFYTLIALEHPLHGYGIMQKVEQVSAGDVKIGPGTLYSALNKLEKQKLIKKVDGDTGDRRKLYTLTGLGQEVIRLEYRRLTHLVQVGEDVIKRLEEK
ncbi:hypothetical protein KP77_11130 [Jeotgalibacillus alimentarius]|uniref:Transcription regulator PadR N-terminal domain-containing protein n=1 Tax=Jeotgalibacillus alimentarius TaxID=135826 RepID=A0A0C2W4T3_9BACL|nr:helix-turn-helix transcriptional regulator [Jeotgalibacillus alimentarius]KIL51601.1 hypothetical protein KP77_11130 [Jeotgalibacillus alimentarius]